MTTMTYDAEFDLDRFVVYLEKLRVDRPRAAVECRLQAERVEERIVVHDHAAEVDHAEPGH
jgi:hypothetical protein